MQLTIFTDYGLRSLMYMAAHPDRLCSVKEIACYYDISINHMVKVIHKLSQLKIILSTKGKGGGIKLAGNPKDFLLGDIILKLEPNMNLVECFDGKKNTCRITNLCKLKHYLGDANRAFINSLNQYTLADSIQDKDVFNKTGVQR